MWNNEIEFHNVKWSGKKTYNLIAFFLFVPLNWNSERAPSSRCRDYSRSVGILKTYLNVIKVYILK